MDDELLATQVRPTSPSEDGHVALSHRLYNAFISDADDPLNNLVLDIDGVSKSVEECGALVRVTAPALIG